MDVPLVCGAIFFMTIGGMEAEGKSWVPGIGLEVILAGIGPGDCLGGAASLDLLDLLTEESGRGSRFGRDYVLRNSSVALKAVLGTLRRVLIR